MTEKTLMVTRKAKNHDHYKKRLEALGFPNVTVTSKEKDALYALIRELKPAVLLMGARFYQCCTPFMMGRLHKEFPEIKMAAVCLGEYPAEIAMYFVLNGIRSYVTSDDGVEQFYRGIEKVAGGGEYVSPEVAERIKMRKARPEPAGNITERYQQVIKLICCGFTDNEIADLLELSRNSVVKYKTYFFTILNVRSPIELVRAALTIELIRLEELYFYPRDLTVNPLPDIKIKGRSRD